MNGLREVRVTLAARMPKCEHFDLIVASSVVQAVPGASKQDASDVAEVRDSRSRSALRIGLDEIKSLLEFPPEETACSRPIGEPPLAGFVDMLPGQCGDDEPQL